jgi:adenylyltransferase/sulfurtransferase
MINSSERNKRQALIKGWSQSNLQDKTAVIIGAGALGNHVGAAIAALGVGTIRIVDFDHIEIHNLNRQFMFTEADVGLSKSEALAERLRERNSEISIIGLNEKITDDNIEIIVGTPDVIIDSVDLIHVRRTLSRYCLENEIPLIHGGISWFGWEAAVLTYETGCANCLYPESLQKEELTNETSCVKKEEASVVYIGQMCGAMMANLTRMVLMPLESDADYKGVLFKYDERNAKFFYQEKIPRKADCEDCLPILKDQYPALYKKEVAKINAAKRKEKAALEKLFQ